VHGHQEPELHRYSDEICAALQIANFLQDLSVDTPRGRCYLPEEDLVHFGVPARTCSPVATPAPSRT
jgi:phytoene/squalene synthetase